MELTIIDVISKLNLPLPPDNRDSYYIQCPFCDSANKKHLNVNLRKNVFRCAKCGVGGGVLDFYSVMGKVPRDRVLQELSHAESKKYQGKKNEQTKEVMSKAGTQCCISDIDTRHKTYSQFLRMLSLEKDHIENLLSRGLHPEDICVCEYKTAPVKGTKYIAAKLISSGCILEGVPGFYRNEFGEWDFCYHGRGILIPVRNIDGKIQGLQIRLDNTDDRKFRWVSSSGYPFGCKAETWCHVSGSKYDEVLITEGPMKGDIVNILTGKTVIAVPGVNSLSTLQKMLIELSNKGLLKIMIAFDMDFLSKPSVKNGYTLLTHMLDELGIAYGTYLWNPMFKGLDDYVNYLKQ